MDSNSYFDHPENQLEFTITEEILSNYKRLDQFLSDQIKDVSRSFIKKLWQDGLIKTDNQTKVELKKMPPAGTTITIEISDPKATSLQPEDLPLEILYEDEHLIIINKAAGMVVHPAPGNYQGTLVNALLHHCQDLQGVGNELRPGIVHRLDKGTSGVMVAAKNQKSHQGLIELFSTHNIKRQYQCLVMGSRIEQQGTIKSQIGRSPHNRLKMSTKTNNGKQAISHYKVLDYFSQITHLEFTLETGRTHQIRVHCSEMLNTPILCDGLYANVKEQMKRFDSELKSILSAYEHPLLHARLLGFTHPITQKDLLFETPPPKTFTKCLESLEA